MDKDDWAEVESIQRLISTGTWGLEGSVGRAMAETIDLGYCVLGPTSARDYWGNRIPSRSEVVSGTKGSIAYANKLRRERGEPIINGPYLRRVEGRKRTLEDVMAVTG